MKRILLSGLLVLAMLPRVGVAADPLYLNTGSVNTPQVDAVNVVNQGQWTASTLQPYETSNTRNYTNTVGTYAGSGTMVGSPGFRFNTFSTVTGMRTMASSFFNDNGALVQAVDGSISAAFCLPAPVGPSYLIVWASNIVVKAGTSGSPKASMIVGANGEMELTGKNLNLATSGLEVLPVWGDPQGTGNGETNFIPDVAIYDQYWARTNLSPDYAVNSRSLWDGSVARARGVPSPPSQPGGAPAFSIFNPTARSYINVSDGLLVTLTNIVGATNNITATNYVTFLLATNITKGAAFVGTPAGYTVQTGFSPSTVPNNSFDSIGVLFSVNIPNAVTTRSEAAYVFLEDRLASGGTGSTGILTSIIGCPPYATSRPGNYQLSRVPFSPGGAGNHGIPEANFFISSGASFNNTNYSWDLVTNIVVTNGEFAAYSAFLDNVVSRPVPITGATVTNLPGRVHINGDNLDLAKTRIRGEGEIVLRTSNLISSSNTVIDCENISLNVASTNGNLMIQSLVPDQVSRLRGQIYMWSAVWSNTATLIITNNFDITNVVTLDTNIVATIRVTNSRGTTNGQTMTVAGLGVRTWTTNVVNPTNQIATATNILEAGTNLYNQVSTYPFAGLGPVQAIPGGITLQSAPNANLDVVLSPGWGSVSYVTNDSTTNIFAIMSPLTNFVNMGLHTLMLDASGLTTSLPVTVFDFAARSTNVVINDSMSLGQSAVIDARSLTLNGSITIPGGVPIINPAYGVPPAGAVPFENWSAANVPNLLYFTNNGYFFIQNESHFGDDRTQPYSTFVNTGTVDAWSLALRSTYFENRGSLFSASSLRMESATGKLEGGSSSSGGDSQFLGGSLKFNNYQMTVNGGLYFRATNSLSDAGGASSNVFTVRNGFNLQSKPPIGDLLGTTLQTVAPNVPATTIDHTWAGVDRGATTAGYTNNTALGKLVLSSQSPNPFFYFSGTGAQNGLYVDLLNLSALGDNYADWMAIDPSLTIYYAAATLGFTPSPSNGVTQLPEEYLNGQFGGRLQWVSGFAGPNSSVAVVSNGVSISVNKALRFSKIIDSNGNGIANFYDLTPFDPPALVLTGSVSPTNQPPANAFRVSWVALPSVVYQVEFTTNMPLSSWQPLLKYTNNAPTNTTVTIWDTNGAAGQTRFYRVGHGP